MGDVAELPGDGDRVDFDLDAEDAVLAREAVGEAMSVRLPGGKVISIPHATDWPYEANVAASRADFSAWAGLVLSGKDMEAWEAANLRIYQVNAIFEKISRHTGVSAKKLASSSGSSRSKRRR